MRSEAARLGEISLDFDGIPPWWDENFPYENAQIGHLARWDRVFFNAHVLFWFGILSKFDLNMATTNTTVTTAGKSYKM